MFYTRRGGNICLQWFVLLVVTFYLSWCLVSMPNHSCIRAYFALFLLFNCDTKATPPLPMAMLARWGGGWWYRNTGCRARMTAEDNDMSRELWHSCSLHRDRNSTASHLCRSNVQNSDLNSLDLGVIANGLPHDLHFSSKSWKSPVISEF